MYISPNTQNLILSITPGLTTLTGIFTLYFHKEAGNVLISIGIIGDVARWAFKYFKGDKSPEARKLDSLDGRLEPLKMLVKKLSPYCSNYWMKGYESDYGLLSSTIKYAQKDIKYYSVELQDHIRFINKQVRSYNSRIKEIENLFYDGELDKCNLCVDPIDESNHDLKEVKRVVGTIKYVVEQVSNNVKSIFPARVEQKKQEYFEYALESINKWVDKAQPKIQKLNKMMKLLVKVQKVKASIDSENNSIICF